MGNRRNGCGEHLLGEPHALLLRRHKHCIRRQIPISPFCRATKTESPKAEKVGTGGVHDVQRVEEHPSQRRPRRLTPTPLRLTQTHANHQAQSPNNL